MSLEAEPLAHLVGPPEAAPGAARYRRTHLAQLEGEAIHVLREAVAQFERPVLLFSGGKDSIVLVHLARKAFHPAPFPFPLLHVDTGHNFEETIEFRDALVQEVGCDLHVASVEESIAGGRCKEEQGQNPSRNALQIVTLLDTIRDMGVDAAFGGARRDEEKARAKERFFSHRDAFGQWDPRNQRPELWNLFNGGKNRGEHFRVFPLSNWTELDIWQYIAHQQLRIPSLYFAHDREVVRRNGILLAVGSHNRLLDGERSQLLRVRCRTIGDITCTGVWESDATTVPNIIREVASARLGERGGRSDDQRSEAAMEDRKREGYF